MTHPASRSGSAIVVVDDDPAVLVLLARMIKRVAGVPVRCFASPLAALIDFTSHPEECGLVITDFDMPGMNGSDMLRAMVAWRPGLSAIFFSGCTEEEIAASRPPRQCRILAKVGGFQDLVEAVQQMAMAA